MLDFSPGALKAIGAVEILGAAGLVLPALLGIAPILVPLAALGLALLMTGAVHQLTGSICMDGSLYPRLARLEALVGQWEVTASSGERVMSGARSTAEWFGDRGGFLVVRSEPPTFIVPEWVGAAPEWTESVIGLDEGTFDAERSVINGRWEASADGQDWTTDFDVTYRRLAGGE